MLRLVDPFLQFSHAFRAEFEAARNLRYDSHLYPSAGAAVKLPVHQFRHILQTSSMHRRARQPVPICRGYLMLSQPNGVCLLPSREAPAWLASATPGLNEEGSRSIRCYHNQVEAAIPPPSSATSSTSYSGNGRTRAAMVCRIDSL